MVHLVALSTLALTALAMRIAMSDAAQADADLIPDPARHETVEFQASPNAGADASTRFTIWTN